MALSRTDAVVIGAGPYGLATASHLQGRGVECRVIGTTMAGWSEHMPHGMYLKSTAIDSSIGSPRTGFGIGDFCARHDITPYDADGGERPIPLDEFVRYGRWFQEHLVPQVEDVRVTRVEHAPDGYLVELDSGERLVAANVVVSVGPAPFAFVPPELRGVAGGAEMGSRPPRLSHCADHAELSVFAGRRVAVVGAGQSALETAVLLREAGSQVHVLVRRPAVQWAGPPTSGDPGLWSRLRKPPAPLGAGWLHLLLTEYAGKYHLLPESLRLRLLRTVLGPAGAWWLRPRFTPDIDLRLGRRVAGASAHGNGVTLALQGPEGAESLTVDHVVAATGYQVDVSRLGFLSPSIACSVAITGPYPRLSGTFEASIPGLYFVGLASAATFGPMLRFVVGTDFAGRRTAAGIDARLHHGRRRSVGRSTPVTEKESAA